MKLKASFDLNEKVYYMKNNHIVEDTIVGVSVGVMNVPTEAKVKQWEEYRLHGGDDRMAPKDLFRTKAELIEYL